MTRTISFLFFFAFVLLSFQYSVAQSSEIARPGPQGIFIFPGSFVPSGSSIFSYKIERRSADSIWKPLFELKTPASFNAFLKEVDKAKQLLPAQPLPSQQKLQQIYDRARMTGSTDSLRGTILHYPVKMALGLIYHDSTAKSGSFQYRVSAADKSGKAVVNGISDWVSMPYKAVFDEVQLVESSRSDKSVTIKWKSAGNHASPLFMVHKVEDGKPANATGITGRYMVNDTTYYTFRDSIKSAYSEKELQYYLVPFDLLGNAGKHSRVVGIASDDFSRASFRSLNVAKLTDRFGNTVQWSFSNNQSVESFAIYRSEDEGKGFVQLATVPVSDSIYTDERIKPEKNYYYFVQANASHGKRFKQSNKVSAAAFMIRKLLPPVISSILLTPSGVEIIIDSIDNQATGIRIFRKCGAEIFTAASDFIAVKGSRAVFNDSDAHETVCQYTVRAEKPGYGISDLSNEASSRQFILSNPPSLKAVTENGEVSLLWTDLKKSDSLVSGYLISRRSENGTSPEERSFIPLPLPATPYVSNYYLDRSTTIGSVYTYKVQSVGNDASVKSAGSMITIALHNTPLPPAGFVREETTKGNRLSWIPIVYEGIQTYRIYRSDEGKDPVLLITLPVSLNEFTDSKRAGSGSSGYYISSVNAAGVESPKQMSSDK